MTIEITPNRSALGAEVRGVDLSKSLTADEFTAIQQAWYDHIVLLFRGQKLSDDDLIRFSRHFGELDIAPASATDMAGAQEKSRPEIWIISNVVENGKPIGALGDKEAEWHTDMSYVAAPPMASVLYSLEIPKTGGDTSFANMYKALEALPDDLRAAIEGRTCNHDASTTSVGELRAGADAVVDVRTAPGAKHPAIRTHPATGGKALYLGRRLNGYLEGYTVEESEKLLDLLWTHCAKPEFSWTHRWAVGDMLIWDNRCAIHRRDGFDGRERRVMHRTQIKGDAPR
ncbi:TauD/TfdA family dioxygenase [Parvibaculum sp.]|uniref:TauD/TfdA dioxygenase family protein n=1 Tax=Parvibaculum sp. TaxID=2024848 RepID=UPI001E10FBFA|nr:TauD/TfdA family dioxygenase [Parvibaculum sp.]MBX3488462.1 TauD/TfdA family dioxygenase [Parvibaculum sp.]MCW5727558.1 TauD/TfdA family dioxygenase [Parvibaculum sp.]